MSDAVTAMPQTEPISPLARLRARLGPRATAIGLALLVELLLALLLLTIAPAIITPKEPVPMSAFDVSAPSPATDQPEAPQPASPAPRPAERTEPQPAEPDPRPAPVAPPQPEPPPMLPIPLGRVPDIGALPRGPAAPAPPRRVAGPPNLGRVSGDTPRVEGSGPDGEALYAASWFREPYDSELAGYLSTAQRPGWGTIACRTIADYRVDSCVAVSEYPEGSNYARAVLAAAWQFRVRPPRIGGQPQVGEWVRIRIYDDERKR